MNNATYRNSSGVTRWLLLAGVKQSNDEPADQHGPYDYG